MATDDVTMAKETEFSANDIKLLLTISGDGESNNILISKFVTYLKQAGLRPMSDIRIRPMIDMFLEQKQGSGEQLYTEINLKRRLDIETLVKECPNSCLNLVKKAITGGFGIPDFINFTADLFDIYKKAGQLTHGANASYIPQMSRIPPQVWGVSVCTVDGQRWSCGDSDTLCTLQSVSAALNYAIAISKLGSEKVHQYVGKEPCQDTATISINKRGLPHNALIQSGAIAMTALLLDSKSHLPTCFENTFTWYRNMGGRGHLKTNNAVYIAEKAQADRKFSIAYFLKEHGVFPDKTNIKNVLDLYFQLCAVEVSCDTGAVIAATIANGGICPTTNREVLSSSAVQNVLSIMQLNGLYDYSGEWMFQIGIPAKSSKSGLMLVVVPGILGMCVYSPPLDSHGNSVRGSEFTRLVNERYSFHFLDNHMVREQKQGVVGTRGESRELVIMNIIYAAVNGDLGLLGRYHEMGVDLNVEDYDGRTALHLACCNGKHDIVHFLIVIARVDISPMDRWNRTPIDDAIKYNHQRIVQFLREKGAFEGPGLVEIE